MSQNIVRKAMIIISQMISKEISELYIFEKIMLAKAARETRDRFKTRKKRIKLHALRTNAELHR